MINEALKVINENSFSIFTTCKSFAVTIQIIRVCHVLGSGGRWDDKKVKTMTR